MKINIVDNSTKEMNERKATIKSVDKSNRKSRGKNIKKLEDITLIKINKKKNTKFCNLKFLFFF